MNDKLADLSCCMCVHFAVFQQEYGSLLGSERAASSGLFPGQTPQPTGTEHPPLPRVSLPDLYACMCGAQNEGFRRTCPVQQTSD